MNRLDRLIAWASPGTARRRLQDRAALEVLAHYRAGNLHRRAPSIEARPGDADSVAWGARETLALLSRDAVRNNPLAHRALQVIVNNTVGTGIEPNLITSDPGLKRDWQDLRARLDTVAIDNEGVSTLAGVQALALAATAADGDVLLVWPESGDRLASVRVLEQDYLDTRMTGRAGRGGNTIYDGIERDPRGRVVAYHLFDEHPGTPVLGAIHGALTSTRTDAARVIHLYRVDRPGQRRGVSWFAPVLDDLTALSENDEAQLMRQKIAACFAAFWRTEDKAGEGSPIPTALAPGVIQRIGADDEVVFANPPEVTGYDDFARVHLRRIAAGLGITYESLTGDLSQVNFSSARLGRIEMGQNVERWQWQMMIPRLCRPLGDWLLKQWLYEDYSPALAAALRGARLDWTPPPPVIADPKTEITVAATKIKEGLSSRRAEIRKLGYEPADLDAEILADLETRQRLAAIQAPAVAAAAQAGAAETERTDPDA